LASEHGLAVQVHIKIIGLEQISINAQASDKIESLKETLRSRFRQGCAFEKVIVKYGEAPFIKLTHKGRELQDEATIQECGLSEGDKIMGVLKQADEETLKARKAEEEAAIKGRMIELLLPFFPWNWKRCKREETIGYA